MARGKEIPEDEEAELETVKKYTALKKKTLPGFGWVGNGLPEYSIYCLQVTYFSLTVGYFKLKRKLQNWSFQIRNWRLSGVAVGELWFSFLKKKTRKKAVMKWCPGFLKKKKDFQGGHWERSSWNTGSLGDPCHRVCQARRRGLLSEEREVKRKPVVLYSPRGDFNSTVKMHGGKIKIYVCDQGDWILYFRILWIFSYPFTTLCLLQRCFADLYIDSESPHFILNRMSTSKHSFMF